MLVVKELKDERGINRNPVLHVQGFFSLSDG